MAIKSLDRRLMEALLSHTKVCGGVTLREFVEAAANVAAAMAAYDPLDCDRVAEAAADTFAAELDAAVARNHGVRPLRLDA